MSAQVYSVNCSADSQATPSTDAFGNPVWLVDGPESILGGDQLNLTCTVFYSVVNNVRVPFFTNVSLDGQDHCYTYVEPPSVGPPTGTFGPEPVYDCCGSWGSYLTEDDRNAGKATSVLSVIACTNYTDGVEIALW